MPQPPPNPDTITLHPRQHNIHGLIAGSTAIKDPEKELLTLYPDGTPTGISLRIGIQGSASYHPRKEEGADTLPYLAIAATPLKGLEVGEYRVEFKGVLGEFPGKVWW